jgi:PIN domain nuclease of toxin-antitoxin system
MKDVFLMDACALIAFLSDERGADKVENVLTDAKNGKCRIYMNKGILPGTQISFTAFHRLLFPVRG